MEFNENTLKYLSKIAKIKIENKNKDEILSSLKSISDWIEKISEIETKGVEPTMHMSFEQNVLRDDVPQKSQSQQNILKNAPEKDSNYFRVPQNTSIKEK